MAVTHKRLGKHGVVVSNLCLGTMNFGWHTSEEDSYKIMDRALGQPAPAPRITSSPLAVPANQISSAASAEAQSPRAGPYSFTVFLAGLPHKMPSFQATVA